MVTPVRKDSLFVADCALPTGLYIVGDSNAAKIDIPHLPTLGAKNPMDETKNYTRGELHSFGVDEKYLFDSYSQGDVIWFDSRHSVFRGILIEKANSNTLLVTERCDNRCSFCSQPPNNLADIELYQKAALAILNFNSPGFIGVSGGEPTINRHGFQTLLSVLDTFNTPSSLHILTNGRAFSELRYLQEIKSSISNTEIMWGIPLYGSHHGIHDELVGAKGAFVQTVQGIINLGAYDQCIELRIIPMRSNITDLLGLMEFIACSFPHVSIVSIMNLEPKGWARKNFEEMYVGVSDQVETLLQMVSVARLRDISVRLFNYPLCLLPESLWDYSSRSISDWKNYYPESCSGCTVKNQCGGFFTSATGKYLDQVEPITWVE